MLYEYERGCTMKFFLLVLSAGLCICKLIYFLVYMEITIDVFCWKQSDFRENELNSNNGFSPG